MELLSLLVAGSLASYQPQPEVFINIKPELAIVQEIQPVALIEAPELPKQTKVAELPKPKPKVITAPYRASAVPLSWWPRYECTWHVATKRSVGAWNNASEWVWQARRDGWTISSKPIKGAIGQQGNHVVYIERVDGNRVYLSERNYDYNGSYRERWAPASDFVYIY